MENKTLLSDELLDRVSGGTISSGISFPDNSISNDGGIGGGIIYN